MRIFFRSSNAMISKRGKHLPAVAVLAGLVLAACSIGSSTKAPGTAVAPDQAMSGTQQLASTRLHVTWAALHLSGRLIYTAATWTTSPSHIRVDSLDLRTGGVSTIFQTPPAGWVDSVAVSPDGRQLVVSYQPPPGPSYTSQETLYILPADGSASAQLLFTPGDPTEQNSQAVWSPNGRYLYYARMDLQKPVPRAIWRVAYPGGNPEKVIDNAYWPRLSADSSRITYVSRDRQSGDNQLLIASADGTRSQRVAISGAYIPKVIDVPMFSPDGQSILFSAPDPAQSSISKWLGTLLTVPLGPPADGTTPSDWWSVPVSGGVPKQLTHIQSSSLYGGYAPDAQHIASYASNGIFVMDPDGTNVTVVVPDIGSIPGTVSWTP